MEAMLICLRVICEGEGFFLFCVCFDCVVESGAHVSREAVNFTFLSCSFRLFDAGEWGCVVTFPAAPVAALATNTSEAAARFTHAKKHHHSLE